MQYESLARIHIKNKTHHTAILAKNLDRLYVLLVAVEQLKLRLPLPFNHLPGTRSSEESISAKPIRSGN